MEKNEGENIYKTFTNSTLKVKQQPELREEEKKETERERERERERET